jgi:hypothetical protein
MISHCFCTNTQWVQLVIYRCYKVVRLVVIYMLWKWQDWKQLLVIVTEGESYLSIKISVLDMTPCNLVGGHVHFGGNCCRSFQGTKCYTEDGGSRFLRNVANLPNYRTVIFLVTTVTPPIVTYLQFLTQIFFEPYKWFICNFHFPCFPCTLFKYDWMFVMFSWHCDCDRGPQK